MKRATRVRIMLIIVFICIVYVLNTRKDSLAPAVAPPQQTTELTP